MSVEQTTQLIQLILNSVLMTVACGLAVGRLGARHATTEEQLRTANHWFASLLEAGNEIKSADRDSPLRDVRLFQVKKFLRRQQRRYAVTHFSLLAACYALLFSIGSIFVMTLRALINADWLIVVALGLFVVSVAFLLLGIGLTLVDLHSSDLSLWEEVQGMLTSNRSLVQPRPNPRVPALRMADPMTRSTPSRIRTPAKARVG
ncbi:DUF2721 domain-containing protein [Kovacikia minuta CCNUW1]|uniref:DUF2721 domain-containing protein n=1 Tax=Kovacikia minuta TaxID=2931930 RepID=UPI001CCBD2B0|nr:DUF2721 domain-containing protein [Kovacikia minuta]UBF24741.1 DUF2721 domain-containing protein [Kovacikia minuta CCNUW1]